MKQKLLVLLISVLLLIFPQSILAAGFQLKNVGSMSVEGTTYDHLWYTSGSVTFSGSALANAQVTATIDGTSANVNADASSNWSYSTTLSEGDHQVSFSSGGSTLTFTLTIGQLPEGVGSLPAAQTPTVGIIGPTLTLLLLGGVIISAGFLLLRRNRLQV